jgi:hypothetical protein
MDSTNTQSKKEWSYSKTHTSENSDEVSKRTGTSNVKPKCIFDLYNTYTHGIDYTDHYSI